MQGCRFILMVSVLVCGSTVASADSNSLPKNFKFKGLNKGEVFTQASLKKSDLTVISFFASWCGKCSETMYELNNIAGQFDDVQWVALSVDEDVGTAKDYFKYLPQKYKGLKKKAYIDVDVTLATSIDLDALPAYVIVDSKGKVIHSGSGHPNANGLKLIKSVIAKNTGH